MKLTTQHESNLRTTGVLYEIVHTTRYSYGATKRSSVMSLCMKPLDDSNQHLQSYSLTVEPETAIEEDMDTFGNTRHIFDVHRPHEHLLITSNAIVSCVDEQLQSEQLDPEVWNVLANYQGDWKLWDYLQPSELTRTSADLKDWSHQLGDLNEESPLTFLKSLEERLSEFITYRPGRTSIDSTVEDILLHREGVCQDISQLMIAVARAWGIPARYVSGYLYDEPGDTRHFAENATHAWVECLLPTIGWQSFDPTNPRASLNSRISVAHGRDYRDVPPVKGVNVGEGETEMDVNVIVLRIRDESGL